MKPFWHPLSTILIHEPRCYASPHLVRMLLAAGPVQLLYAGDRMFPALRDGDRFEIEPLDPRSAPRPGQVVLACPGGIPELLRVVEVNDKQFWLAGDADVGPIEPIGREVLLAAVRLPVVTPGRRMRLLRRLRLDFVEATTQAPDESNDPADTVRAKYDFQAPFYARTGEPDIDPRLLEQIKARVPPRGRVLVVGSGTGRECFALAGAGFATSGVDFSPAMVALAREEAARRGLAIDFQVGDIRAQSLPPGELDAALFTYDVYSFLPQATERIEVLRSIRGWLSPKGVVYLSARRAHTAYEHAVLTLQWLGGRFRSRSNWGASHTRWVGIDGSVHRSFVQVFREPTLRAEVAAAGFRVANWLGGHILLEPT